jgi:integrase
MVDIMPTDVRDWIRSLRDSGVTPANIRHLKAILSAIFTTALNDQVTFVHPCKGVKTPTVARKILRIITPEQFDQLHSSLRDTATQLLVETGIETGLRWGELTELRVRDFDSGTQMLTIGRAVVQVNPRFHPTGGRFLVKEYPKDGEFRRFKVTRQLSRKLEDHMGSHDLGDDDLLFSVELCQLVRSSPIDQPHPAQLGFTDPTPDGRQYLHGTLSAYSAGGCHCVHCRRAYAVYRAKRRSEGRDQPRRPRSEVDTDGHIPRDWFRLRVWQPAAEQAGLGLRVRMHDLRHAHASWLLAGGADLQVVKERLGHASITTTEKYLHTLPDADETALAAFELTRNHVGPSGGSQSVIPP